MINYTADSIWNTPAEYIVVPVNCVGAAGAGMALSWKQKYPQAHSLYREYCSEGLLIPGDSWWCGGTTEDKKIVLFTTKNHWKNPTKIEWIESGLKNFVRKIKIDPPDLSSYAFTKLGCGLGGLNWESEVEPLMNKYLGYLKNQIYFHI